MTNRDANAMALQHAGADERFSTVAIVLHWMVATLVLFNVWLGWQLEDAPRHLMGLYFDTHKSIGVTVLGLVMLRILWRITHRPPVHPATMPRWQVALATVVHWAFYVLLIGLPISGLIGNSTNPPEIPLARYFGEFQIPLVPWFSNLQQPARGTANAIADGAHLMLGYVACALVILHVLGAMTHQLIARDRVLYRMLPLRMLRRERHG